MDIIKEFIADGRPNRPGTTIAPKFITIHNTSNTGKGADAKAHSRFVRETGFYMLGTKKNWVSWHFTVDDKVAIQHLPVTEKGFHAGGGNATSLGLEICMHQGIDQDAAFQNAADVVGALLRDLGLEASAVRTHESWTGKKCPVLLIGPGKWSKFVQMVEEARAQESDVAVFDREELKRRPSGDEADPEGEEFELDHDAMTIPEAQLSK